MLRVLQAERIAYVQAWRQENVGLKKKKNIWKFVYVEGDVKSGTG